MLSAKVGINHEVKVIQAVCKMLGRDVTRTPSERTVWNINDRIFALSLKQISEQFTQAEETTLHTNETINLVLK